MSYWFWIGLVLLVGGITVANLIESRRKNTWNWDPLTCVFMWVCILSGIILMLVFGIRAISLHYARASCNSYAKRTGQTVKFVTLPAWSTACLVRVKSGKWIPNDQIGNYNQ